MNEVTPQHGHRMNTSTARRGLVLCTVAMLTTCSWLANAAEDANTKANEKPKAKASTNLDRDKLVAWCIVPFDAKKRSPEERAEMIERLGMKRVAYDWRSNHVEEFEREILAYKKHGIEYFAFWSWHPAMEPLIKKHGIKPQIWKTNPTPKLKLDPRARYAASHIQKMRVEGAAKQLLPLVKQTKALGLKLGLYNHGGWGGEPANLVAVCEHLRKKHDGKHVGIIYNLHHGHSHTKGFAEHLKQMQPYLLCLNLNGMNDKPQPKILPIGQGKHDARLLKIIEDSGYDGPVGILDHVNTEDAEVQLKRNLDGLAALRKKAS